MMPVRLLPLRLFLSVAVGFFALLSLLILPSVRAADPAAGERAAEVRAVWISNAILGRTGGPAGVQQLLDQLAAANFNVILPEAVFRGYTLYPGPYQDPRFAAWPDDPLAVIVREAKARGMEVHPWVWVFAAGLESAPGPILASHPEWAECLSVSRESSSSAAASRTLWLTPSSPEVRRFLRDEFLGILRRYPVDGLHLDYIRYAETPCGDGVPHASAAAYLEETGIDPRLFIGGEGAGTGRVPAAAAREAVAWHLWLEGQVSAFVQDMAAAMRAENPRWVLSAAVTPEVREARYLRRQDWEHWLRNGWLDYAFPMAYSSNLGLLQTMVASWESLGSLQSRLVPGLLVSANDLPALLAQIEHVRAGPTAGVALFSADYLLAAHVEALGSGAFSRAVPVPFRDADGTALRPPTPGAFLPPTDPPVFIPIPSYDEGPRPNLAAAARVTVDSSFRGYGPAPLNDGRRNDEVEIGRWAEVAWASAETPEDH
ncbi:MAG: hypothetical protein BAA04_11985 [Firmicutes bacterium ZCTH02-B6]|nr:MAG: hypothetical protein BAA04_11985 [Firmicutes bacterium ZCTH02-B6]